ncbi:MAG: DUF5716 family protein [Eubacteriales bacterium]|nr:DUF5716 family protein [Eubacteriales bacterium]
MDTKQLLLGIDIERDTMLLSYQVLSKTTYNEPVTVREKGNEQDGIALAAAWDKDRQEWVYGTAASEFSENRADAIFERFFADDTFHSDEMICSYEEIVTGYIRYCLQLLHSLQPRPQNTLLVLTVDRVTKTVYDKLKAVFTEIGFRAEDVMIRSHQESFFYYMTAQDEKLWGHAVLLLDYRDEALLLYRMNIDRRTKPKLVRTELLGRLELLSPLGESETVRKEADEKMVHFLIELTAGQQHSSLFLVGSIFEERWFKGSLQYMAKLGRVFQGRNLFSRGAIYAGLKRLARKDQAPEEFFIGEDMVTTNIGLDVTRRGKETYFPLLTAGTNWYDGEAVHEFLLQDEESLRFSLQSLSGKNERIHEMLLPGLVKREHKTVRIRVSLRCESKDVVDIRVTELGFGEFFASTGKVWEEKIDLS